MNELIQNLHRRLEETSALFENHLRADECAGCAAALLVLKWTTHAYPEATVRHTLEDMAWEIAPHDEGDVVDRLAGAVGFLEELIGHPIANGIVLQSVREGRVPPAVWCDYVAKVRAYQMSFYEREDLARLYLELRGSPTEEADQFATPAAVADLTYQLLAPRPGMSLHDLTCARGSWLLEAGVRTRRIDGGLFPLELSGRELRKGNANDARVALWLAGLSATIMEGDSLITEDGGSESREGAYDRVFSHPPFGQNWDSGAAERRDVDFKSIWGDQRCSVNMAFVARALSLLKESGRAVILNPQASLSRKGGDQAVRRKLVESDVLEQVIQLPAGLFSGSTVRACIFVLNRQKAPKQKGRVLFVDLSREFSGTPNQSELSVSGIRLALGAMDRGTIDGISTSVDCTAISKNDYDLEPKSYFSNSIWRGKSLAHEWVVYEAMRGQRADIESAVEGILAKLNHGKTEESP